LRERIIMSKPTKGPWEIGYEGSHVADVSGIEVSAPCLPRMHRPDDDEREANARLVAAAPDLLDLLRAFLCATFDSLGADVARECECVQQAEDVLARVEGKVSV